MLVPNRSPALCAVSTLILSSVACLVPSRALAQNVEPKPSLVTPSRTMERASAFLDWPAPLHRNPLQADPRIIAALLRPWLLSARFLDSDLTPDSAKIAHTLPPPTSYKLTPDPLNWT